MESIQVIFGRNLASMINGSGEFNFHDWLGNIKNQVEHELSSTIPKIELLVSNQAKENEYQIFINNMFISSFSLEANESYYIIPSEYHEKHKNEYTFLEPSFGLGAIKISSFKPDNNNYNKVTSYQILSTHLCKSLVNNTNTPTK